MAKLVCTLMACQDCLMLVANGEPPEDRPNIEREISAHLNLQPLQHLVCADSDSEHEAEFSWSQCECCGSTLGGSRHQLAVLAYNS